MKYLMVRSGMPCCVFPLAQEFTAFPSRIYGANHNHCGYCDDQEDFHAHRIARTRKSVLYRGLSNAKQLCKSNFRTFFVSNPICQLLTILSTGVNCPMFKLT